MGDYRATMQSSNRDFRDQFKSVEEYKAAISRLPKVPSLIPHRSSERNRGGLNRAPSYSRNSYSRNSGTPPRNHRGYNQGKSLNIFPKNSST